MRQREDDEMCFFISFAPATFWLVVGYFVLFSTSRVEGGVRTFGRVLAAWIVFIAAAIVTAGAWVTVSGMCSLETFRACAA